MLDRWDTMKSNERHPNCVHCHHPPSISIYAYYICIYIYKYHIYIYKYHISIYKIYIKIIYLYIYIYICTSWLCCAARLWQLTKNVRHLQPTLLLGVCSIFRRRRNLWTSSSNPWCHAVLKYGSELQYVSMLQLKFTTAFSLQCTKGSNSP